MAIVSPYNIKSVYQPNKWNVRRCFIFLVLHPMGFFSYSLFICKVSLDIEMEIQSNCTPAKYWFIIGSRFSRFIETTCWIFLIVFSFYSKAREGQQFPTTGPNVQPWFTHCSGDSRTPSIIFLHMCCTNDLKMSTYEHWFRCQKSSRHDAPVLSNAIVELTARMEYREKRENSVTRAVPITSRAKDC